ncbi:MAG: PEP-CTERM sorting domain-containing protein [Pirellulales bacterium]
MSKRSFLRKSAVSLATTLGLGTLGSDAFAQISLPPNLTIGVETITPGLLEGRLSGSFNTTAPNPGTSPNPEVGGIKLEPRLAQISGSGNVEPWPDNTTHIYTGQFLVPDNGTAGDGIGHFAMAEHFDDNTLIKIDGITRLSNQQWDVPNTTGVLNLPAGWHDLELRFGEGGGGWGPSNSGGWDNTLGFGIDFTVPIAGDTTQANYIRPVDNGSANLFRVKTYNVDTSRDNQNVNVTANGTLNLLQGRVVPFGALTVADGTTFTVEAADTATFTQTNVGAASTFAVNSGKVVTGPLRSTGAVTSLTKTGAGELSIPTAGGSNVTSVGAVNVNAGRLAIGIGSAGATSIGSGPINLNGATLSMGNDLGVPAIGGLFGTTASFYPDPDIFNPVLPGIPDSANGLGWSGLDTKALFDSKLAPLSPSITVPVNLPINFPRGDGNLVDGGTNDDLNEIFNTGNANLGVSLNGDMDFISRFTGKLNVASAGATEFLLMSNDGANLFIDLDQGAGTNWQKVIDNNRFTTGEGNFQGHSSGSPVGVADPALTPAAGGVNITNPAAPTLSAGVYDYIVGFYNKNTNEAGIELFWDPAGGADAFEIIPYAIATGPVSLNNELNVSGNSSLEVTAPSATLANLRMNPGSSLTTSGNAITTGVTATGAGTVTIGTSGAPVNLTTLNDGGNAVSFMAGPGVVNLTRVGGPGPALGATSSVGATTGGRLIASNSSATETTLGGASVLLTGGTLELSVLSVPGPGATLTAGLLEGRLSGSFNTTAPNPGTSPNPEVGGIKLEPRLAQISGSGNVEPWPDNTTHIYTGQFLVPDNGTPGDGLGHFAMAEHFDDNTLIKIDGVTRLSNQNWDIPNTTGALTLSAGWHDLELRFGEGGGGWGPSNSGGWDNTLGFGIDTTLPIEGDTTQANYVRPVDNGSMNLFRTITGPLLTPNFQSNVSATENSTINVVGATGAQIGSVSVADGKTLTATGNGLTVNNVTMGAGGAFSMTGPSKVTGALNGAGTLLVTKNTTVDFTNSGAAGTGSPKMDIARGGTVNFTAGSGNTFGGAAVSTIANEGLLHAANGVTDLSGATMTTANVPGLTPGLLGGRVTGSPNATDFPTDVAGDLSPSRANTTNVGFFGGNGGTWVYRGEVKIPDTDGDGTPGPVAFGEQFDDYVLLKIDGEALINNNAWNVPASTGAIERADTEPDGQGTPGDGWFSFEGRFGDSGGGIGANTGWDIGFGIDTNPADGFDTASPQEAPDPPATRGQYVVVPADNGSMNLFRFDNPALENIRVDAGATLKLGAMVNANIVTLAPTSRLELHGATSKISHSAMTIPGTPTAPTATLDVTDSAIAIDYPAAGPNPSADTRARILAARGGTDLLGTWTGQGITSSSAAADNSTLSVGWANNADLPLGPYTTFRGQPVDDTTVLIRGTRIGDANLDGVVNDDDVTIVGATFGMTSGAVWALGDFTYDGAVNDDDVTLLGALYNPTATPVGDAPVALAGAVAAVPEPATWLMLSLGGLGAGLFGWRRRKV